MLKRLTFFIATIVVTGCLYGQTDDSQRNYLLANPSSGRFLGEIPLQKPATKGTSYLDEEWSTATIYINPNTKVDDYSVRYDVANNLLEIRDEENNEVKAIYTDRIHKVEYQRPSVSYVSSLVNSRIISSNIARCLLEELEVGERVSLYKQYFTTTVTGNYIVEFDAGEKADKIILKERFFIYLNDKTYEVKNKNKFIELFDKEIQHDISSKMKKDKIKITKLEDLKAITAYINGL